MKFNFIYIIFILIFLLLSCSSNVRFSSVKNNLSSSMNGSGNSQSGESQAAVGSKFTGEASYYADKYHGRMTANGEIFDMNKISAAHKTLPFGTKLKVTNISNGKTVTVKINDRGPFVGGRIIDLSKAAAERIGMIESGVTKVELEVIE